MIFIHCVGGQCSNYQSIQDTPIYCTMQLTAVCMNEIEQVGHGHVHFDVGMFQYHTSFMLFNAEMQVSLSENSHCAFKTQENKLQR